MLTLLQMVNLVLLTRWCVVDACLLAGVLIRESVAISLASPIVEVLTELIRVVVVPHAHPISTSTWVPVFTAFIHNCSGKENRSYNRHMDRIIQAHVLHVGHVLAQKENIHINLNIK